MVDYRTLRTLPDSTQHSKETDIHALGWICSSSQARAQTNALYSPATGIGISVNTHSIWLFAAHSSYCRNIMKQNTMKKFSNFHNYIRVYEKKFNVTYTMYYNR